MKRTLVATALVAGAAALTAAGWHGAAGQQGAPPAAARPAQGAQGAPATPPIAPINAPQPPGLRGDVQRQLDDAEQKLVQLASVMPPDKFAWRPVPGVRSFGEVCLHVAGGNYEVGSMWGMKTPPGVDLAKIEQQGADKGNAVAAMRVSFEQVRRSIAAMPDSDVDKTITYFGRPGTVRWALIEVAVHAHEHLGQAIVYARMNGIVPPWTAAENSAPPAKPAAKPTGR